MNAPDRTLADEAKRPGTARGARSQRIFLGLCLLACLLLGGVTQRGVLVEAILQVLVIAASTYALLRGTSSTAVRWGLVLASLVLFAGILQLLPFPLSLLKIARPAGLLPFTGPTDLSPIGSALISLSVARTIEAVIFALVPILFFMAATSLPKEDRAGLLPFFVIGLACNLIAAGLQYSFSGDTTLGDLLGYSVMVGMFANVNHFSTLVFSSIPLIVYFGFFRGRPALATFLLVLIFLILLAAGSRAGILIGLAVVAISLGALIWRGRIGTAVMLALLAGIAVYGYGALIHIGAQQLDPDFGRREFALTTWRAIRDNWLWGTGFGTFDLVYPFYESRDMVHVQYVNHAHNDFLELFLEGGIVAVILLLGYAVAVTLRAFKVARFPLQRLVLLSIIVILLHSLVDYPLRTMAIAMSFAFFNVLLFSDVGIEQPGERKGRGRRRSSEEILPPAPES
ncbi:MAG: O-antigen ligase family protein [Mesorhizobium sp.]